MHTRYTYTMCTQIHTPRIHMTAQTSYAYAHTHHVHTYICDVNIQTKSAKIFTTDNDNGKAWRDHANERKPRLP